MIHDRTNTILETKRQFGSFRSALGCALAFAIAVYTMAFCSQDARATCGDYLHSHGRQFHEMRPSDASNDPHEASSQAPASDEAPASPAHGCRGPQCRKAPLSPNPAPAPTTQLGRSIRELAAIAKSDYEFDAGFDRRADRESANSFSGYPPVLDRPPIV